MKEESLNLNKATILVVDDTPANIDLLQKTLEPKGYNIMVALNGENALKAVERKVPDLILLDVMMPGIDGFETCRQLKAKKDFKEIPVIFLTAKNETEDIVTGFSVGGVDYITKPFRYEEVCARVQTHLHLQHLKKELESKNKKLEVLNDLKNKFLGMASHDLRNPLTSIRGFAEILKDDIDILPKEERDEYLDTLYSVSDHMLNLVNDLLDVSVIESGKLELELKTGDLKPLVEARVRLYEATAKKKNITLHSDLSVVPHFRFDPNRIGQVLDNLITNAIKFSPSGKTVFINLEQEENTVKVSIRDEGPGITPEDQRKLFQHFQKLSARPTGGESSTGLGLAIAKKMVEGHGGRLELQSTVGEGATFIFKIPIKKKNGREKTA